MNGGGTHLLGIGFRHVRGGEKSFTATGRKIRKEGKETAKAVGAVDRAFLALKTSAAVAATALGVVAAAAAAAAAALVPLIVNAARFEAGLVGVGKTANIEGARLQALGEQIDGLSRRLPNSADELLGIAQAAGQLGVQGEPAILAFTETIARLGSASDLSGEEAATALARILNVTGESAESVGTLASVIVALGNNFAATESQIARHAGEVARSTAVYNIGSAQAAAYATTLAAFGVQAELAGSAVGRAFRTIESAVKTGGAELERVAKIARVSGAELAEAYGRSPAEAFGLFLQGLRETIREGGNVAAQLKTVKLSGEEVLKVLPVLAKEYDALAKAEAIAAAETADATALAIESEKAQQTLTAQWKLLGNEIASAGRVIGAELLPAVKGIVATTKDWVASNREALEGLGKLIKFFVDVAAAIFKAVLKLTEFAGHIDDLSIALTTLVGIAFVAWLRSVAAAAGTAAAANGALASSIAAIQAGYGKLVLLNMVQIMSGWASAAGALALALGPVVVAIAAIAAVAVTANVAIKHWAAESQAAIDEMTASTRRSTEEWENFEASLKEANEEQLRFIEIQLTKAIIEQQLLMEAAKNDINRYRTSLAEAAEEAGVGVSRLEEWAHAVGDQGIQTSATKQEILSWLAALDAATQGHGEGAAQLRVYQAMLERVLALLSHIRKETKKSTDEDDERTKALKRLRNSLDSGTAAALAHARAASAEAATLDLGDRAVRRIAKSLEIRAAVEAKVAEATTKGLANTKAFQEALKRFEASLRAEAAAEEYLAGAKTIQRLEKAIALEQARATGSKALVAALELEARIEAATAEATDDQADAIERLIRFEAALASARRQTESIRSLREEVAALEAENAARAQGAEALREYLRQRELEAELQQRIVTGLPLEIALLTALIQKRQEEEAISRAGATIDALEDEIEQHRFRNEELRKAIAQGLDYAAAMREVAIALRTAEIIRENPSLKPAEVRARVAAAYDLQIQTEKLEEQLRSTETWTDKLAAGFAGLAEMLAAIESPLAGVVVAFADLPQAIEDYRTSMKGVERGSAEAQVAMDGLTQSISGAVAAAVVSYATPILSGGGTSNFGGELSGSYAAEGAQLGESFGGAWGAFAGMVMGSFFEKAGDTLSLSVSSTADGFESVVHKATGELANLAQKIVASLENFFDMLATQLGGLQLDMGAVDISVEDNLMTVVVDGIVRVFRTLDEALAWAAEQVLHSNRDAEGIGENMRALFENLDPKQASGSFRDLADAIDLARRMDEGFVYNLKDLGDQLLRDLDLARQYGLSQERVLELHRERMQLAREEIELSALQFAGASSIVAGYLDVLDAMNAYDAEIDRQAVVIGNRMQAIQDEIAAIQARGAGVGAEGGVVTPDDIARWREEAHNANMTFSEFTRTLGEAEQAAIKDYEMLQRLEEEYAALAKQLGMMPEQFTEAYRQMLQDVAQAQASAGFLQEIVDFQNKYGAQVADTSVLTNRIAEMEFRIAQIRIQLLVVELAKNAELLNLSRSQLNQYQAWAQEIAGLEFTGVATAGGGGRRQARQAAAEEWNAQMSEMADLLSGVSSEELALRRAREDLIATGREARRTEEEIAQGLSMLAQLQVTDIVAPYEAFAAGAGMSSAEAAYTEAGERATEALAQAAEAAAGDPHLFDEAQRAIDEGLSAQLAQIGSEGLAAFGESSFSLRADIAETIEQIDFLSDHAEELGLSARDVARTIRETASAQLYDIAISEAERVGDTAAANALRREQAQLERDLLRIRIEGIRLELEAAGVLNDHFNHIIDRTLGRIDELDAAAETGDGPGAVESLRDTLTELVERGLSPAIVGLRRARREYNETIEALDAANISQEEYAAGVRIADEELSRARQEAALGVLGEVEALARAAGVDLPVEMAREWADIQFQLAKAQLLVALGSDDLRQALEDLGIDVGEVTNFVLGLDAAAEQLAEAFPGYVPGTSGKGGAGDAAGDAADELARLRQELAKLGREAELAGMDDYAAAVARINDQYDDLVGRLEAAHASQADLAEAERLRLLELAQLQEEVYGRATEDIRGLLEELRGGELSGRPAQDLLAEQMAALRDLAAQAAGGDLAALQASGGQARVVLDLIAQVYGSAGRSGELRSQVEQLLAELAGITGPMAQTPQMLALPSMALLPQGTGPAEAPATVAVVSADAKATIEALREEHRTLREVLVKLSQRVEEAEERRHEETLGALVALRSPRGGGLQSGSRS